ncbi:hypothetical protein WJX84_002413 [Apatococcus fuscideae]|uniref:F-box domain-containing protein n=1 Tax=Apatococcus fuscideae TaxID=2026836 RepID=A0AAW1T6D3_9CHLO
MSSTCLHQGVLPKHAAQHSLSCRGLQQNWWSCRHKQPRPEHRRTRKAGFSKRHSQQGRVCCSSSNDSPSQADLVAELAEAIRTEDYAAAAQIQVALREATDAQQMAVQSAFQSFYQAFAACDMRAMERIWGHGDHVQCMHPSAPIVAGREMVLESWKAIFQGAKGFPVELEDVRYSVGPTAAYVTCLERVGQGDLRGRIAATNIFEKQADGQWHLGSPTIVYRKISRLDRNLTRPGGQISMVSKQQGQLHQLPSELWPKVLNNLGTEDLLTARLVSRKFVPLTNLLRLQLDAYIDDCSQGSSLQLFLGRHCTQRESPLVVLKLSSSAHIAWPCLMLAGSCANLQTLDCSAMLLGLPEAQTGLRLLPASLLDVAINTPVGIVDDPAWKRLRCLRTLELCQSESTSAVLLRGCEMAGLTALASLTFQLGQANIIAGEGLMQPSITALTFNLNPFEGRLGLEKLPALAKIHRSTSWRDAYVG